MTDVLNLTGSIVSTPSNVSGSGLSTVSIQLAEQLLLNSHAVPGTYVLTSDSPQSVAFGALAALGVNFVQIQATGGPVTVTVTSAAGTSQVWPCDDLLILFSKTVAITAISVTRSPGVETFVDVVLGQISQ